MKRKSRKSTTSARDVFPQDDKEIMDVSSSTKLYKEDYAEVQSLCAGGATESAVIRELVRRGLYARRYRQATNDPAFRELLRTFGRMVENRLYAFERRTRGQMDEDFGALAELLTLALSGNEFQIRELKPLAFNVTPEEVSEEDFVRGWAARIEDVRRHTREAREPQLRRRRQRLQELERKFPWREEQAGGAEVPTAEPAGDGAEPGDSSSS